jgi:hypothetical protein
VRQLRQASYDNFLQPQLISQRFELKRKWRWKGREAHQVTIFAQQSKNGNDSTEENRTRITVRPTNFSLGRLKPTFLTMRSTNILTTAVAVFSSSHTLAPVLAKEKIKPVFDSYQPKEIKPELAQGGLQKLIDRGVFKLEQEPTMIKNGNIRQNRKSQTKRRQLGLEKSRTKNKGLPNEETRRTQYSNGYGGDYHPQNNYYAQDSYYPEEEYYPDEEYYS